ncbi:TetR family transcriptional regulator C-terminal domain-containing protein [Streptomyces sp. CNQ085]|uniref:TetR family transcriptional regulator C-terminal domain-containing protein n=1 Tax=Streptomyces sp. CNQ085 TaxID=2886944 RepID=UPI001F5055B8|nr:TetR family transcriptional regulator C-terminal domain-containing protein [Streptomyces sp. CNQ085]MCI0385051.1 TetR family transcriptional regulator C-terminal domain-containing protein [Streptomyces sp. CNQ085]
MFRRALTTLILSHPWFIGSYGRATGAIRPTSRPHTLFLRALDHYRATESAEARQRLHAGDRPVREVLREWMLWLVTCPADGDPGRGCLVVNTATEIGTADQQVHQRTEAAFKVTQQALRSLLTEGRDHGQLPADLDIDAAVELLFTTVLGLRVRERAGHDLARLTTAIDIAIRALGSASGESA